MKIKTLLIALAIITSYVSFANDSKATSEKKRFDCTASSSSTKSGSYTDCDGNSVTVSVTSNCSATSPTCEEAQAVSGICASLKASKALRDMMSVLVRDCP